MLNRLEEDGELAPLPGADGAAAVQQMFKKRRNRRKSASCPSGMVSAELDSQMTTKEDSATDNVVQAAHENKPLLPVKLRHPNRKKSISCPSKRQHISANYFFG
jgi:hypothetical protein